MKDIIKINETDNVIVALKGLNKGEKVQADDEIELLEDIKMGHKIAIRDIKCNEDITKYGFPIGHAVRDIKRGEHVHVHNIKTNLSGLKEYQYNKKSIHQNPGDSKIKFRGYVREDGLVGIRNELWIIPTVGCINGSAEKIIEKFKEEVKPDDIDYAGVFTHNYGCSQSGQDEMNTRIILNDMVKHPNAGGVLVLGLGCEYNNIEEFKKTLGSYNEKRVRFLVAQEVSDEVEEGLKLLKELYYNMQNDERVDVPISELKIGLKCGGSDGLSGLTANPLLGAFSDFLTSNGGTTVLTEVAEMFGAETLLMERAENREVFDKIVNMINGFKEFCIKNGDPISENPSPGNKDGGITTLEDKSLGCTQKAGTSEVKDVLKYGEIIRGKGLHLLDCPSNDLVASSGEAAAGCQMVLFTTGRGTPFGSFVPTVKVSTNSYLYNLKKHWIDFNAGQIVEGNNMSEVLKEFIEYVISVASGRYTNNEKNDFRELAIFKSGVTL